MPADLSKPSLISDGLRAAMLRLARRITGLAIMLGAIMLGVAMLSSSFADPSSQTASTGSVQNWLGPIGAEVAARLFSFFYLAAPLLALSPLIWGWRLFRNAPRSILTSWKHRVPMLLISVFIIGMGISASLRAGADGGGGIVALAMRQLLALFEGYGDAIPDVLGLSAEQIFGGIIAAIGFLMYLYISEFQPRHLGVLKRGLGRLLWPPLCLVARLLSKLIPNMRKTADADAPRATTPITARKSGAGQRREPMLFEKDDLSASADAGADASAAKKQQKARPKTKQTKFDFDPSDGFQLPPLHLLKTPTIQKSGPSQAELQENAVHLEAVLADYRVEGQITDIRSGPVVTRYDLVPAPGIKSQRVISLADDIARSMSAMAVRVAVVPGQNVIGIELPNQQRETVFMRDILGTDVWEDTKGDLPIALGKDIAGAPVVTDLARMPHLLVAGTTGSGKSVGINSMILSLLYHHTPDTCRLIMIDPKMLELSVYDGIPHLLTPVVTDPAKAIMALKWAVQEMDNRYRNMSKVGVRNITGYNEKIGEARAKGEALSRRVQTGFDQETGRPVFEEEVLDMAPLPYIVVIIDEVADLMMVAGKEIDIAVQRLAQKARAAGIHVIMATQRPSVDVITGTIKSNFPTRISFQVASKIDSRTILNEQGAEQLLGRGDMLFVEGGGRLKRVHGPFMSDEEVEAVADFLRAQGEPDYDEQVTEDADGDDALGEAGFSGSSGQPTGNSLYDQAVALVVHEQRASISFVQRHLKIGYNRAATLIEEMEAAAIVSRPNHAGKREVLIDRNDAQ